MHIGVPKEVKEFEDRVGLTPSSVKQLVENGHKVLVQSGAAKNIGIDDNDYLAVGAEVVESPELIWNSSDLIVKVKEPQENEFKFLKKNQILFTYLHLAPDPQQAEAIISSGCTAIAYETVTDKSGGLPLLAPMSMVAGRMSVQCGAHYLENPQGGRGQLLAGVPGVLPAKVVILGGGIVGTNAALMAVGLGASVYVFDLNPKRLYELDMQFGSKIRTIFPSVHSIEHHICEADLVIGAVLIPGASAPKIISEELVKKMQRGSVMVDVSIDQGGCFETSVGTTHASPTYSSHGVIHYCVTNMPGAVARTSTFALNNATLPYIVDLANKGWRNSMIDNKNFSNGLNVHEGKLYNKPVADALGLKSESFDHLVN